MDFLGNFYKRGNDDEKEVKNFRVELGDDLLENNEVNLKELDSFLCWDS